jgi:ABC-type lipoprotein export system ATPase subunit
MKKETEELLLEESLGVLIARCPQVRDILMGIRIETYDEELTTVQNLEGLDERYFDDYGTTRKDFLESIALAIEGAQGADVLPAPPQVSSLEIMPGHDKDGVAETRSVKLMPGEVVGIVGKTGAGKSCLLADIECLAQDDTASGRRILINGCFPSEEERALWSGRLVAQLSQNMNFVIDLTVAEFLKMHADSRDVEVGEEKVLEVFNYANTLTGESFALDIPVTQLSGGQSRALMIADTMLLSESPVILIDEIENAGIDRRKAVETLGGKDKIVLVSTHDPLLALSCDRRIVIRNGAIADVIDTSDQERRNRDLLDAFDKRLMGIRERLREGDRIEDELATLMKVS